MPEKPSFQAPKGTRDFYPADLLRRRYIEKAWRDTSIRHGFEEIEGPTFETAELYTVKSGEGILGEMFGVFSGKDEDEVRSIREGGRAPLALRPEFTPTLARMYAARAGSLPKPTKWFTAGPYFRAEKPQRGRLREFLQWNVDVIGGDNEPDAQARVDAEPILTMISLFALCGLTPSETVIRMNHRGVVAAALRKAGVNTDRLPEAMSLLDKRSKISTEEFDRLAKALDLDLSIFEPECRRIHEAFTRGANLQAVTKTVEMIPVESGAGISVDVTLYGRVDLSPMRRLGEEIESQIADPWVIPDPQIVRGLAYYTGTVFEAIAEGERAIAGGGRYDNLIQLFGGPPTPAVGFGMGDVVLGNLLDDKGLMPEGPALLEALSAPSASLRPDVFVIANEKDESQAALRPLVARLRRGVESESWRARSDRKPWDADRYTTPPLHARHSYKATKNIGKLLKEAGDAHVRHAVIIESSEECTLKNLATGEQSKTPLANLGERLPLQRRDR